MSLCDHLRTDEDICLSAAECARDLILREALARGIGIHSHDSGIGKKTFDLFLDELCAVSAEAEMLACAFGTKMRNGDAVSAIMADESAASRRFVMRQ